MVKKLFGLFLFMALIYLAIPVYQVLDYYNIIPKRTYSNWDFDIRQVYSSVDYNGNSTDDYTDILLGAREDAQNHPLYDPSYVQGGYPRDNRGVCTDVVWRALKKAGYSLRDMVDKDIMLYPQDYPGVGKRDNNIDFRRVVNLRVFFDKYATELTTDTADISQWQRGDIVIFKNNKHIGVVSDKRNRDGQSYIIHNGGQPVREEDYLKRGEVLKHYRFDTSNIPDSVLIAWED